MLPPTPTAIPLGTPIPIDLDVGLWNLAPNAVGLWNTFDNYTPALQTIFFVVLLILLIWTITKLLRGISEEEA